MAVKVISSYHDDGFEEVQDFFFNNFSCDDWDFILIGDKKHEVEKVALKLQVMESEGPKLYNDLWYMVTYHS